LTILKQGDLFRFFINSTEVEFLKLEGHFGGSAGLTSDHGARPSFDDFEIVDLAEIQPDYNADNQRLNIPLLDVLNAGAAGSAYEAALNLNSVNPVAFDLAEIGARQADDALFSRYDIFSTSSSISLSPHRPAFDFNDNTLRIPSVRLDDGAGGATLLQVDLELRSSNHAARFELSAADEYAPDCSAVDQNRWLYDRMMAVYYWYDRIPAVDPASYSSTAALLGALRYGELDRWSYIASRADYTTLFEEGTYIGVGLGKRYDSDDNLRVSHVYPDSPADKAGVKRGWKLLKINGKTIQEIEDENLWGDIWGEDELGVVVQLKFEDLTDNALETSLVKELVRINTVFYYDAFDVGAKKVGYLVYMDFLETSEEELNTVFSYFKGQGVDELILDLRYNTGGRVHIANLLASLISGVDTDGEVFAKTNWNDKRQDRNYEYIFEKQDNSLNLSRLIVISSASTCSASELVINGLKPFLNVVTVGSATCGKPVGMSGQYFCDKILNPIVFETRNADDEGGYFGGVEADCPASDDLTAAFGDRDESSLKESLYYLENGRCSGAGRSRVISTASSTKEIPLSGWRREIGAF
ncbi:MAG: PDZ domain-containing protein, partial [Desulfobacterales bacterium]|nr:PDZ domain-containing protein [Desulfobacterales bacterium]